MDSKEIDKSKTYQESHRTLNGCKESLIILSGVEDYPRFL